MKDDFLFQNNCQENENEENFFNLNLSFQNDESSFPNMQLFNHEIINEQNEHQQSNINNEINNNMFSMKVDNINKDLSLIQNQLPSKENLADSCNKLFEKDNNLTLVAVARRSERIAESPHEVVLQAGDTLLFECSPKLKIDTSRLSSALHFFDSSDLPNISKKTIVSTVIMITMVMLSALNIIPLLQCAFLAAFAMLLTQCCSIEQGMKSINWEILMVFAGSVVLGLAIQKTGIAERMAFGILHICGTNPLVVMAAICLVANITTEFISNTAAGAMFFPIMYQAAEQLGYEPYTFLIALMISVSSSFSTPIGSPTHMLVYGPGGYRFSDFIRIGIWMNLTILVSNIFITNILYPLTPLH